jgi:Asp-tRNA(Asn)/Glu-tRNA(Gln) amidotransferase A subunit family amidase
MTIPIGQKADHMPMSSYWMARRFDEARLLRIVCAAEQGLNVHLRPELNCGEERV